MRNEWFGDKRDHLKWTSLLLLARREEIAHIVQVAVWTDPLPLNVAMLTVENLTDAGPNVAILVADFFHQHNHLANIRPLGRQLGITIDVMLQPFDHATRAAYFAQVVERIRESEERTIWFFDPDTGIEPATRPSDKHVLEQELAQAFDAMPPGDFLA